MKALNCNPALRNGAQLLAKAKAADVRAGKADLVAEAEIDLVHEVERKLETRRLCSDATFEALAVVKALQLDAEQSLDALSRLKSRRRRKVLSFAVIGVLSNAFEDRSHFQKFIQLLDQFGVAEEANSRRSVFNMWLVHELKFGVPYKGGHPLLVPEVFQRFIQTVQEGDPAVASFPIELQDLIRAGQVGGAHGGSPVECKKVLVVSDNWNFFPLAAKALEDDGFEVRYLDFGIIRQAFPNTDRKLGISYQTRSIAGRPTATAIREALADRSPLASDLVGWADVVFCEWLTEGAVWMSHYLQEEKPLIVRLHSYEAFTAYPLIANFRRINGLVFIAPQIRKVLTALVGEKALLDTVTNVIPNIRDVSNFNFITRETLTKKTLGMTQYASANKDPIFALDILKELQVHDPSWRLRFVGKPWGSDVSDSEAQYQLNFKKRLSEFGDSVSVEGYTNDIASWYRSIGFVLSTSQREGSHESLVEGMLTGAIPVLRNWPMMAPFGAPESVFPDLERVNTAAEAAAYILQASDQYEIRSKAAADYAVDYVTMDRPEIELPRFVRAVCRPDRIGQSVVAS
ncbi:hypothetical protein I5192_11520 [Ruegeria sp. SCSIO 43209]|uniref:hypothetical protein n=1 Tax=Ruegeria sp. SCSIO 43209 TaxID=2793010 RepID=UPI001CA96009|nr:hypothetical protein [Ruegeria sp. SCSIO 43209]UAB87863.1 hypothetical protein I5192_11520 [Ruegeria sp. SCSIO 43209]